MPFGGGGASERDGGNGPSGVGAGGAYNNPTPQIPAPGEGMFVDLPFSLGAAQDGGIPGSQVVIPEVPGDLGSIYTTLNTYLLLVESRRENASFNGMTKINNRYRGHREAFKYNLIMQKLAAISAQLYLILKSANDTLKTRETVDAYPTDTEVAEIYHIQAQIKFKEWMLLKQEDKKWFL